MADQNKDRPAIPGDSLVGAVLNDRYKVIGRIGVGGMAAVFEGRRIGLERRVAIKVLKPELAEAPSNVRRFLREARAASVIEHDNIVDIVDFGPMDSQPVYFVMEFLEGHDLRKLIKSQGAQPWPVCREVILEIVAALEAAHEKGIVHRDVKPANVFLVPRQNGEFQVKVLDFGIAKIIEDVGGITRGITMTNGIIGTVAYMAPEQAFGTGVDARTDVYAVGVLMYEMLTGAVPFRGRNHFLVLEQHVNDPPPPPTTKNSTVPPEVEAVCLRCLEKDPANRYQSMGELREAIFSIPAPTQEDDSPTLNKIKRIKTDPVPAPASTEEADAGPMRWSKPGSTEKYGEQPPQGEIGWGNPETSYPAEAPQPPPYTNTEPIGSGGFDHLKGVRPGASSGGRIVATKPAKTLQSGPHPPVAIVRKNVPNASGAGLAVGFGLGLAAAAGLVWFGVTHWPDTTAQEESTPNNPDLAGMHEGDGGPATPQPVQSAPVEAHPTPVVIPSTPITTDAPPPPDPEPPTTEEPVAEETPPARRRKNRRNRDQSPRELTSPEPAKADSGDAPSEKPDGDHTVHPDLKNPYK